MKIAVFASGSGSNFLALAKSHHVVCLVCDREDAPVVEKAKSLNVETLVKLRSETIHEFEVRAVHFLQKYDYQMICLAGYMRILSPWFVDQFPARSLLNIHPSYLPLFPGRNGYEDSFNSGSDFGGVTVHFVDHGVDTGEIVRQQKYPKIQGESFENFKKRGLQLEHQIFSEVVTELEGQTFQYTVEVLPSHPDLKESSSDFSSRFYWVKSLGPDAQFFQKASEALIDPVTEVGFFRQGSARQKHLEQLGLSAPQARMGFHFGVTDNPGTAALQAFQIKGARRILEVRSGSLVYSREKPAQYNPLLNWLKKEDDVFGPVPEFAGQEALSRRSEVQTISLDSWTALKEMNAKNWWALSDDELKLIQAEFLHLNRKPTDVEMEVIAQTWSEHCKHKIFRAQIEYVNGITNEKKTIHSLFQTFIRGVTLKVLESRKMDWLISVFHDNAGVVRFDKNLDISIKVETHNSPSALDPYGGALTGILGVNRDILGVGLGAKPIANLDVFCLAPDNLDAVLGERWPENFIPPEKMREGVWRGVKDGGNKSGIPNVTGAFNYDISFSGKPLVYCGTVGAMPHKINGRNSSEKATAVGDVVVMVGGRIGKDGIHGATFSSMAWEKGVPSHVVQIGDPFTQKKVMDFVLTARDQDLFSGLTDNGAGGLSSSVGEMALKTGGVKIDLSRAPTKYAGLLPWELMVSESQERMTLSVPPDRLQPLLDLAKKYGVEATALGHFTESGRFEAFFEEQKVCDLRLSFLHDELPPLQLQATRKESETWQDWTEAKNFLQPKKSHATFSAENVRSAVLDLLRHPNIKSHEKFVRGYDHEVLAATTLKPFSRKGSPNSAGVLDLGAHGGEIDNGIAVGVGLCPQYSRWDSWWMGFLAVDEAVRNVLCSGGDPEHMALVDNFCWPDPISSPSNPSGALKLAMLVETCEGMAELALGLELPFVSGKDSMKNDSVMVTKSSQERLSVVPTLLVTCLAQRPQVSRRIENHILVEGLDVFVLRAGPGLLPMTALEATSLFSESQKQNYQKTVLPKPAADFYKNLKASYLGIHSCLMQGQIHSIHDLSEGGLLLGLAEMSMGEYGIEIDQLQSFDEAFNEGVGQFILIADSLHRSHLQEKFGAQIKRLGITTKTSGLTVKNLNLEIPGAELLACYRDENRSEL